MKINANSKIEGIFAQAVAMDNRGLKNMIHCIGSNIYIVNFDHSMILKFTLKKEEIMFEPSVSFNANEYDSPNFTFSQEKDGGKIIFKTTSKGYERRKICRTGNSGPDAKTIHETYKALKKSIEGAEYMFYLSEECVSLLEDGLSHTEISVEQSQLILRQRNVYTGTIVEVASNDSGFFQMNTLPDEFSPVAIKTKDFASLFMLRKSLAFIPGENYIMVKDPKRNDFEGFLALCKYDMIIDLYQKEEDDTDGRKEQKKRASESQASGENKTTKSTTRKRAKK